MGKMSFDRCTRVLEHIRRNIKPIIESDEETQDEALERAIETMRKYQKIQELMRGWNNFNSYERMCDIYEVIEDGND